MKTTLFLLTFYFFTKNLNGQYIYKYNDWFSLVVLEKNEKVYIKEKAFTDNGIFSSYYGFKRKINQVLVRYFENSLFNDTVDKYDQCQFYPNYVNIKNNDIIVINDHKQAPRTDSLVFDKSNRIIEAYQYLPDAIIEIIIGRKFIYKNDSTVYEINPINRSEIRSVILYEMNSNKELKKISEASLEKQIPISDISKLNFLAKLNFFSIQKFKYNSLNKKLQSISTFKIKNNSEILENVQSFVYRGEKPIRGEVRNKLSNKIIYTQFYTYKY